MKRFSKRDGAPVKMREKVLKDGTISLYLDTFEFGKHRYEFLHLYIVPELTPIDKERNRVTMMQAEAQRAKRIIEMQNGRYGAVAETMFNRVRLSEAIQRKRESLKSDTRDNYDHLKGHVIDFGDVLLRNVTKGYLIAFFDYLRRTRAKNTLTTKEGSKAKHYRILSDSTIYTYSTLLCATLNKAMRDGLIPRNPFELLDPSERPKQQRANRAYLTIDEVKAMREAHSPNAETKRAFLFACYTALRISDIRELTFADVRPNGEGGYYIDITQQKTRERVIVPLSDTAIKYLGAIPTEPKHLKRHPFHLPTPSQVAKVVKRWAKNAGIDKAVTFHTSRHTAATLLLTYGADIYTTSKILGHTNIATTQVYAEVINEKKAAAIEAIPAI